MTTQAPPKAVTFVARSENQYISIEDARKPQFDPLGRVVVAQSNGKHVQFQNNMFVANEASAEKIGMSLDELLAFLRGHENFNMNRTGGFWEEGAAPDEPRPTLTDQMRAVATASAAGDLDLLSAIRGVEEETHKRHAVFAAIEAAEIAISAKDTAAPSEDEDAGEPSADGSDSPDDNSGETPPAE